MDFLQRSTHPHSTKPEDMITSKSREKDKLKNERARDEISTFFKPKKTPLEEVSSNSQNGRLSTIMSDEISFYERQMKKGGDENYQAYYPRAPRALENDNARFSRQDRTASSPRKYPPAAKWQNNVHSTPSLWSGKATTCLTWSETQVSPTAIGAQILRDSRQSSPPPDFVRTSLERTGILRDTGISLTPELTGVRISKSPVGNQTPSIQLVSPCVMTKSPSSSDNITTPSQVQSSMSLKYQPRSSSGKGDGNYGDHQLNRNQENPQASAEVVTTNSDTNNPIRITKQILIEHYDPVLGWHQRQNTKTPDSLHSREPMQEPKGTPLSREQIAKWARIKRPYTTVPITRFTKNETYFGSRLTLPEHLQSAPQHQQPFQSTPSLPRIIVTDPSQSDGSMENVPSVVNPKGLSQQARLGHASPVVSQDMKDSSFVNESNKSVGANQPLKIQPLENQPTVPAGFNDSSAHGYSETGQTHLSHLEPSVMECKTFGLPLRGSWVNHGQGYAPQFAQSLPLVEPAPLYFRQMREESQFQTQFDEEGKEEQNAYFNNPAVIMMSYLEEMEQNYFMDENENIQDTGDFDMQGSFFLNDDIDGQRDGGELQPYSGSMEGWQDNHNQELGDVEYYEERYEPERLMYNSENILGSYGGYKVDEGYFVEQKQERDANALNMKEGFWRTQRNY